RPFPDDRSGWLQAFRAKAGQEACGTLIRSCRKEERVPSIPISDGISIAADADPAPWSSLAKYAQELPHLIADKADLSRWRILTLSDPALQSLDLGIDLEKPVTLADGVPQLTLGAGGALHTQVITGKLFSPDHYGDNIAIPDGQSALRIGTD